MNYFLRFIVAAVGCALTFAILPPFFDVVGLSPSGSLMQVIKIGIAGIALWYVALGPDLPWKRA